MLLTTKCFWFCFLLFFGYSHSDELLQRREAYILTKSSWLEVKAKEKEAYQESKKERRILKKQIKRKIRSAEKMSVRYDSPRGDIYINKLYNLNLPDKNANVLVKIDNGPEKKWDSDFLVLGEGLHTISYKILDNNGLVQREHTEEVILDLSRPELSAQLEGEYFEKNSFYYYKPGVKLFLDVRDQDSGVEDIFINLNRKGYLPMGKIYKPVDSPGLKEIKILAMDKVTNISQEVYLRYAVDAEPPVVDIELNTIPELHSKIGRVCDRNTSIRLNAFDLGSGVSRIEFRKRGQKNWRVYRDYPLVPVKKKKISLEFRAIDNLGNVSEIKHFKCKVKNEEMQSVLHQ